METLRYPYNISTITAVGKISETTEVDIETIAHGIPVGPQDDVSTSADIIVRSVEYGSLFRGTQTKKKKSNKVFGNQVTVVVQSNDMKINVKMFKNGNIQVTGIKEEVLGKKLLERLCELLSSIVNTQYNLIEYKICLINSDYDIGFQIKREALSNLIVNRYQVECSYEPCIYPGVMIKYLYNDESNNETGVCVCDTVCNGKGSGNVLGQCRKISIAVFQSGKVIITGAHSINQLNAAYKFLIEDIVRNHTDTIKKPSIADAIRAMSLNG